MYRHTCMRMRMRTHVRSCSKRCGVCGRALRACESLASLPFDGTLLTCTCSGLPRPINLLQADHVRLDGDGHDGRRGGLLLFGLAVAHASPLCSEPCAASLLQLPSAPE